MSRPRSGELSFGCARSKELELLYVTPVILTEPDVTIERLLSREEYISMSPCCGIITLLPAHGMERSLFSVPLEKHTRQCNCAVIFFLVQTSVLQRCNCLLRVLLKRRCFDNLRSRPQEHIACIFFCWLGFIISQPFDLCIRRTNWNWGTPV